MNKNANETKSEKQKTTQNNQLINKKQLCPFRFVIDNNGIHYPDSLLPADDGYCANPDCQYRHELDDSEKNINSIILNDIINL